MPGLVPPARPKPLRRGVGPGIHVFGGRVKERGWPGQGPAMTAGDIPPTRYKPRIRPSHVTDQLPRRLWPLAAIPPHASLPHMTSSWARWVWRGVTSSTASI
ncbi:hypothetical protein CWO91_19645 [Bradyrhizobium genosp. SA-3]|nr:hypothetical protein CWO91_19645 [Bradyrhizobium genosp. SA-3]